MLPVKAHRGVETIATVVSTQPVSGSRDDNSPKASVRSCHTGS